MDWLKDLIKDVVAEDKLNEVVESFKKEFPKHAVTKTVFNETNDELKTTKASLAEVNSTIDQLKNEAGSVEEYKSQIEALKADFKTKEESFQTEVSSIKKKTAYKELLIENGVNKAAVDLLVDTANFDEIKLSDEGSIMESAKLVTNLKETRAPLFNEVKEDSPKKDEKHTNDNQKADSELSMAERFEKMGVKPLNKRYT